MKPNREIEVFVAALRQAHAVYPDMRVGQLIDNALSKAFGGIDAWGPLFYIENDELAAAIRKVIGEAL